MFSGLVREIAYVKSFHQHILRINSSYVPDIGDSIAINGMCLTVIALHEDGFSLEVSTHSASHVALENYTHAVHIEPALRADARLDGHFVQGHIDAIGIITHIQARDNFTFFTIEANERVMLLAMPQGSITIDGISLTIAHTDAKSFTLAIIPHTMQHTLFSTYTIGRRVNIETDVLARSVLHILSRLFCPSGANASQACDISSITSAINPHILQAVQRACHSWSELDDISLRY